MSLLFCAAPAMACDPAPGVPGEDVSLTLEHDGEQRSYILHLPTNYDCETPLPMLLGLHGYTGTGDNLQNRWLQIFDHVNDNGYIGVFPDGMTASAATPWARGFNDQGSQQDEGPDGLTCIPGESNYPIFENCPASYHERQCNWGNSCADDLGFFRVLISHLAANFAVDEKRIYMTGYSQGASTVNGLAPEMADLLAAVAPLHGFQSNGYSRGPESPLPYLQVWGRTDRTTSGSGEIGSDGLIYDTAIESSSAWAGAQGCNANGFERYPTPADGEQGWECMQHSGCPAGAQVVSCAWDGAHTWPVDEGGSFAWDVVWEFLSGHARD